jgi:hypothetical protein
MLPEYRGRDVVSQSDSGVLMEPGEALPLPGHFVLCGRSYRVEEYYWAGPSFVAPLCAL